MLLKSKDDRQDILQSACVSQRGQKHCKKASKFIDNAQNSLAKHSIAATMIDSVVDFLTKDAVDALVKVANGY